MGEEFFTRPLVGTTALLSLVAFNPDLKGHHEVIAGDSLPSIAAAWYGAERAALWTLIAQANGLLAATGLTLGMTLGIPDPGWRAL